MQTYNRFFVYAYSDGKVVAAENNRSRGYRMSFVELVDRYNYSCDDYSEMLMLTSLGEIDYAEAYGECFFRLSMTTSIGIGMTYTHDFVNLTSYVDEMSDNVLAYAGVLIGNFDLCTEQHSFTEDQSATTAIPALLNRPDYNITYHNGSSVVLSTSIAGLQGTDVMLEMPNYASSIINGERPGVKLSHGIELQPPVGFSEYRFAGWLETENADEGFFTIVLGRIHNINLYAVWTEG